MIWLRFILKEHVVFAVEKSRRIVSRSRYLFCGVPTNTVVVLVVSSFPLKNNLLSLSVVAGNWFHS